jgi:hypothetical protein
MKPKRSFMMESTSLSSSRELDQPTCNCERTDAICTISFTGASYPPNILFSKDTTRNIAPLNRRTARYGNRIRQYLAKSAASLFNLHRLATQIGYTGTIRGLLLFPDPTGDPDLQLLPVTT